MPMKRGSVDGDTPSVDSPLVDDAGEDALVDKVMAGGPPLAALIDARFPSRVAFARAAGLSAGAVSRLCSGEHTPGRRAVYRMCKALGLDFGDGSDIVCDSVNSLVSALGQSLAAERQRSDHLERENDRLRQENMALRTRALRAQALLDEP